MNIDAKPCQISELMPVEGKIKFNIPDYQRKYWNFNQWYPNWKWRILFGEYYIHYKQRW